MAAPPFHPPEAPAGRPLAIALAGLLSLAIAMGIGRFAFTPLLPMMLHDGVVDLPGASWLATANYLGYWLGALACALQPALWRRWGRQVPLAHTTAVRIGLVSTVVLTLGMALPVPALWPLWRGLAGVASALVFVYVSGWCLARLTALGAASLAGIIFVGPGLGITLSGLAASAMVAQGLHAAGGWAAFALLATVLTAVVWPHLRGAVPVASATLSTDARPPRGMLALFTLGYGLAGFGYIVTATFLPVIARQALPGSVWLDLFWPLFGLGVAIGALLTVRLPLHWDRRHLLMACYGMQAGGVLLSVWLPSLFGFALGSLLLGLPFTAITLFAMQEARRLRPHNASAFIGTLTAAYGLGQIAGPPLVAWLLTRSSTPAEGFAWSLQTAAAALGAGVLIFGWLSRRDQLSA
ncbi:arabinose efflux permease family protein [Burkholderiales bacterium JOSHI_001]|nr:arabinose efflux permease family protein [Burkholderiales bacterium JOSHI_001]